MEEKQLMMPYQYLRFVVVAKFTVKDGNWIIDKKDNQLVLPMSSNTLQDARDKARKWIDNNYEAFV